MQNPDQLKHVHEKKVHRFSFLLTSWPPAKVKVTENSIRWWRLTVPISMVGMKEFGVNI